MRPLTSISRAYDVLLFDLDGTFSDPLQGIGRSINYALQHCGFEEKEISQLAPFIGPPLDKAFEALTGTAHKSVIETLVAIYRERYLEVGFAENVLYSGVFEALSSLHGSGVPLGVCTSKRRDFAGKVLRLFQLSDFFQFVDGGDVGREKWQQIAALLSQGFVTPASLMIGDRAVDIRAAHRNGLKAGGALWGYGARAELEGEHPEHLFASPGEWSLLERGYKGQ